MPEAERLEPTAGTAEPIPELTALPADARSGARSGIVVLAASMVGHLGNYLFYVIAARLLGAERFSEVSALIAYALILFLPFNGVQVAAARDVARLGATSGPAAVAGLIRSLSRWSLAWGGVLGATLLLLSPFLTGWLHLSTVTLTWIASLWVVLGVWLVISLGVVQGMQRFNLLALTLAGPLGALRTLLLPLAVLLSGLAGALWAMVAATVLGLLLLAWPIKRAASEPGTPVRFRPGASMISLLAFASLTNVDVLVAKATLHPAAAGAYSAAALMGKIALYAPSALAMVLLPKAAAALAQGRPIDRLVSGTFGLTAAAGLGVAAAYALLPAGLLSATFGPDFAASAALLAPMSLVMTGAAIVYVHLNLTVAREHVLFGWLVNGAAVAHLVLLALWHDSPAHLVAASAVAVGLVLLLAETFSPHGAVRTTVRLLASRRAHAR